MFPSVAWPSGFQRWETWRFASLLFALAGEGGPRCARAFRSLSDRLPTSSCSTSCSKDVTAISQTWPMTAPVNAHPDAAKASTAFVVSHRVARLRPTQRDVCQESDMMTSGHEVVRPKVLTQWLHRPHSAAHPHAYGFLYPYAAVPG